MTDLPQPTTKLSHERFGTLTFTLGVGRLIAGQVERALRERAHGSVDIQIEKHMGLLDGVLLVTAEGYETKLRSFLNDVKETWHN